LSAKRTTDKPLRFSPAEISSLYRAAEFSRVNLNDSLESHAAVCGCPALERLVTEIEILTNVLVKLRPYSDRATVQQQFDSMETGGILQ